MLTPLAVGPGQPFPYISALSLSLGVFVRDPETGEERLRPGQGPGGAAALRRGRHARAVRAARGRDRPLPRPGSSRRWRSRACAVFRRDARRRLRGLGRGGRPARGGRARAPPPALRRRRPDRGRRVGVAGDARAAEARAARRRRPGVPRRRACSTSPTLMQLAALDRPELKDEPWVPVDAAALRDATAARRDVRGDREGGHARPPARTTRSRPASRRSSSAAASDPDVIGAEGDGLPDERRVAARAGADRGGRERQAERLPRRAEGPVRRAPEHRVVAGARARGRPRRLRLPEPEDPREGDARRPPRGRRAAPLRPHRHRQLPRGRPRACTRTSGSSPPTRTSPPTSPTSSTTSPGSASRSGSASSSSRRSTCATG